MTSADTITNTTAEVLRRAALAMRERAQAATPSGEQPAGWYGGYGLYDDVMLFGGPTENGYRKGTVFRFVEGCADCDRPSPEDLAHIETFADPAVALAVAAWLEHEATKAANLLPQWKKQWNDDPVVIAALTDGLFRHPLALAGAYLREGGTSR